MSINEEAVAVVQNGAVSMERAQAVQIVHYLSVDGLLAPAPQIIRTVQEWMALDGDALLLNSDGKISRAGDRIIYDFPVVVVASGERVRACREALERETT